MNLWMVLMGKLLTRGGRNQGYLCSGSGRQGGTGGAVGKLCSGVVGCVAAVRHGGALGRARARSSPESSAVLALALEPAAMAEPDIVVEERDTLAPESFITMVKGGDRLRERRRRDVGRLTLWQRAQAEDETRSPKQAARTSGREPSGKSSADEWWALRGGGAAG